MYSRNTIASWFQAAWYFNEVDKGLPVSEILYWMLRATAKPHMENPRSRRRNLAELNHPSNSKSPWKKIQSLFQTIYGFRNLGLGSPISEEVISSRYDLDLNLGSPICHGTSSPFRNVELWRNGHLNLRSPICQTDSVWFCVRIQSFWMVEPWRLACHARP